MSRSSVYRQRVAGYIKAGRHLQTPREGKPIRQIAAELGIPPPAVRRWLRKDHREVWMQYWPSLAELWAEGEHERSESLRSSAPLLDLPDPTLAGLESDQFEMFGAGRRGY